MVKRENFMKLHNKFEELSSFSDDAPKLGYKMNFEVALAPFIGQAGSLCNSQSLLKRMTIPSDKVGLVIGRKARTVNQFQAMSGARIQVTEDMDADRYSRTRDVTLCGSAEQIRKAANLINGIIVKEDMKTMHRKSISKNINQSASSRDTESFTLVDGFKVKLKYCALYKATKAKYGDIRRPSILDASEMCVVWIVSDLLSIVNAMCQLSQMTLTVEILDDWDKKISLAEHLKYNVAWLRDEFEELRAEFERKIRIDTEFSEFLNFSDAKQNDMDPIEAVISFLTSHLKREKKSSSVLRSEDEDFLADITVEKEEDVTLQVQESSLIPSGFKLELVNPGGLVCFYYASSDTLNTVTFYSSLRRQSYGPSQTAESKYSLHVQRGCADNNHCFILYGLHSFGYPTDSTTVRYAIQTRLSVKFVKHVCPLLFALAHGYNHGNWRSRSKM